MNTCIITGATGYIGSHLLKYLLSKKWEINIIADPAFGYDNIEDVKDKITIFEYDRNMSSLISFFKEKNVDVVFHLAAAVLTNYKPEQVPIMIQSNIQFGAEILEAMKCSSTRLLVSTGTYWQNYNSSQYNPVDLYAATKEAFEKIAQLYVDAYNFKHVNLRLFDVYGEDDRRPKLWNILKQIAGTNQSIDLTPGEQLLDMVHIYDVCTAYEAAYYYMISTENYINEIFGVCTGKQRSLKEIVSIYQEVLGKRINVRFGGKPYKEREVMNPKTDYLIVPDWEAKINIFDGFKRFRNE